MVHAESDAHEQGGDTDSGEHKDQGELNIHRALSSIVAPIGPVEM